MWTIKNHHRYDRDSLGFPSDLTDAERVLIVPLQRILTDRGTEYCGTHVPSQSHRRK